MPADAGRLAARCDGVVRIYRSATDEVHALREIDASFPAGMVTGVVGPSGSGKSSLLRILAGIDRPTAGRVVLAGVEVATLSRRRLRTLRRRCIGLVEQRPADNLLEHLTARQHLEVAAAVRGRTGPWSGSRPDGRSRSMESDDLDALLELLGLTGRAQHRPGDLSGGEQQRLAIGRAVVSDPALLVADEPTAELDSSSGAGVLAVLEELARRGTGVVLSTHERIAAEACDRVLILRHGSVASVSGEDTKTAGTGTGGSLAVIDRAGRIQLPPEALALFVDRRAVLRVEDGEVRLTAPDVATGDGDSG